MCFTVQLSRSVPFPELFVPASAATRLFYHNVLRLSRTFFQKFFGFCSPQTDHFWSYLELQEPKPVAFWLLVISELLYLITAPHLCQEFFWFFFQSLLNFWLTSKDHRIPGMILCPLSVWRPPQRQLSYNTIASFICQQYFLIFLIFMNNWKLNQFQSHWKGWYTTVP